LETIKQKTKKLERGSSALQSVNLLWSHIVSKYLIIHIFIPSFMTLSLTMCLFSIICKFSWKFQLYNASSQVCILFGALDLGIFPLFPQLTLFLLIHPIAFFLKLLFETHDTMKYTTSRRDKPICKEDCHTPPSSSSFQK
jgi:hypothetical protein